MQTEAEISPTKRYAFPRMIEIIGYEGKHIVVSPLTANWIVLENEKQLQFFNLLEQSDLGEALSNFEGDYNDAQCVVTQLEARHFERTEVCLKQTTSSAHIYLTNACNMRCPHCYMYAGESLKDELNREEILSLIEGLAVGGVESVVFSGGEPLMNANLSDFVKAAHSLNMKVEILSNGTMWTEKMISELSPCLSSVQISIDGFDEDSNSKVRGKGNFARALKTIDSLIAKGVKTSVAMAPKWSGSFEEDAECYIDFALRLLEKYSGQPFDFNITGELWEGRNLNLTSEEKARYKAIVSKIYRGIYGEQSEDYSFVKYHRDFGIEENCAFGNLSISANGDVYLCAQIQPLAPIGNIRTHTIEELFNTSKTAKIKSEISKLKPCADCAVRYICGGDCRIKYFSYFDEGKIPSDVEMPERHCSDEYKNSIYEMMVRTNQLIFQ